MTGIFDGPQIRTFLKDKHFMARMTDVEARAWVAFANVMQGFLGNKKNDNYREIVDELLLSLRGFGCRMSIKLHYLELSLGQVSRQPWRCQRETRREVPSRHGRQVSRSLGLAYDVRLLLELDES